MFVAFFVGVIAYGAITLVFLILSSAELLDSGMSTATGLASVLITSLFWPVTLVVMSIVVLVQRLLAHAPRPHRPAMRLVQRTN